MARTELDNDEPPGGKAGPQGDAHARPRWRRWLSWTLAVGVVVGAFVIVLPQMSDMAEVWRIVRSIGPTATAVLLLATLWNQITYWLVSIAALPGLSLPRAATMNLASTAVANTVPAGGGFGVGVTAAMLRSWTFTPAEIGRYVAVTGIWNNFVKLGMPIVALALLAFSGDGSSRLVAPSVMGVIVLVVSVAGLVGLLRSEGVARRLGQAGQAVIDRFSWLRRHGPADLEERATAFREDSSDLLLARWHWLTAATVVGHTSLFLVLLVTVRVVGIEPADLTWIEVLAGFAFVRLITAIPVTPGAVGLVELGYVGAYTQFGADENAVVAAVLVFRLISYLLPIPLGGIAYLVWSRADGRHRGAGPAGDGDRDDAPRGSDSTPTSAAP